VIAGAFDVQGRPTTISMFTGERTLEGETYEGWLARRDEERHLPSFAHAVLKTAMGQRSFDPGSLKDINSCLRWLEGQPEFEGVSEAYLRGALASVEQGRTFKFTAEEA
jgi:hypothetical protein